MPPAALPFLLLSLAAGHRHPASPFVGGVDDGVSAVLGKIALSQHQACGGAADAPGLYGSAQRLMGGAVAAERPSRVVGVRRSVSLGTADDMAAGGVGVRQSRSSSSTGSLGRCRGRQAAGWQAAAAYGSAWRRRKANARQPGAPRPTHRNAVWPFSLPRRAVQGWSGAALKTAAGFSGARAGSSKQLNNLIRRGDTRQRAH